MVSNENARVGAVLGCSFNDSPRLRKRKGRGSVWAWCFHTRRNTLGLPFFSQFHVPRKESRERNKMNPRKEAAVRYTLTKLGAYYFAEPDKIDKLIC